jgi:hypothetical protein
VDLKFLRQISISIFEAEAEKSPPTMSASASVSDIMNSPLHPPPKGKHSNFVNPESHGYILTDVCSVFLAVMTLFYAVRIYGRFFVSKRPRWDDRKFYSHFEVSILPVIYAD